ncbi:MAG TPA: O-antigen ligase family protein [Nitrospirota bacterium]|nr:O-antigen ligase family protein [Nitrospirota bacterium]
MNSLLKRSIVIALGLFLSLVVVFDPYITNVLVKQIDLQIFHKNILRLYPYEISSLLLLSFFSIPLVLKLINWVKADIDKSFLLFFLIGLQTVSLTTMGSFDGSEFLLIVYFLLLLPRYLIRHEKLHLTLFHELNILLFISVLLASFIGGFSMFARSSLTMVKFALIILLIVNTIRDRDNLVFLLKWLVIITTGSSLIALFQEVAYKLFHVTLVGIVDEKTMKLMYEVTSFGVMLRVPGFCGTYKPFSFFLNTAILILLNYYLYNRKNISRKQLLLGIFALSVMSAALVLTFSKDAWLSLIIGLVFCALLWRPYLVIHFAVIAVMGVFGVLLFSMIIVSFWDKIHGTLYTEFFLGEQRMRLQLAREGILGFLHKHPIFGAGIGRGDRYTGHYFQWSAHNALIQAADETGILGLLSYLAVLIYTFFNSIRFNLVVPKLSDTWIARGLLTGFVTFVISIQFHPFFIEKFTWFFMSIIEAFAILAVNNNRIAPQIPGHIIRRKRLHTG